MIRTLIRRLLGLRASGSSLAIARHGPPQGTSLRLIVVHWKIKLGREVEFLHYWASHAPIANRSGLVSEFLSSVADSEQHPWINLQTLSSRWTSFFNVGLWCGAEAFHDQVGRYIDNTRPVLDFEAERRERVFLAPERWRTGQSALPTADPPGVL